MQVGGVLQSKLALIKACYSLLSKLSGSTLRPPRHRTTRCSSTPLPYVFQVSQPMALCPPKLSLSQPNWGGWEGVGRRFFTTTSADASGRGKKLKPVLVISFLENTTSQNLLPILVLNFGDVSALQHCNFYGSEGVV